ncbi:MAG: DUF6282 family protein [Candidatus Binatia bacterium]
MREASVEDAKLSIAGAIGFQIRRSRWRLKVTDEAGKVTKSARQCLELIAKHEMVLATAHISPAEMQHPNDRPEHDHPRHGSRAVP